jgi:hypothetical protein
MYSALAAAAGKLTPAHLSEVPTERITRAAREKGRSITAALRKMQHVSGRVDLYCHWRKTDFLVELKQRYIGLRQNHKHLNVSTSWKNLITQVSSVQDAFAEWSEKGATIGVLCVCPWSRSKQALAIENWTAREAQIENSLMTLKPSFLGIWKLSADHWIQEWEGKTGSFKEVIPFIFLIGHFKMLTVGQS